MAIPSAVKKAADRAEELRSGSNKTEQQPEPEGTQQEAPPDTQQSGLSAVPTTPASAENFEQKYKTLQAKYDAEVPRYSQEVQQLQQSNQGLKSELESIRGEMQQLKASREQEVQRAGELSDAMARMKEDYSDEAFVGVIEKQQETIEAQTKMLDELRNQLGSVQGSMENFSQHQARTAEDQFWHGFNEQVPDASTINSDPAFIKWMSDVDPFRNPDNKTRQQLIEDAARQHDLRTAVHYYSEWKAMQGAQSSSSEIPEAHLGADTAGAGGASDVSQGTVWTLPDINAFYRDVQQGKYRGRPEEMERIERDIHAAQREGRIR